MAPFQSPTELIHNRGLIADPAAFAEASGAASWRYLCGEEFATTDGGMSYADVWSAVAKSVNLVADPPRPFDRRRSGASADEVLTRAGHDDASYVQAESLEAWVVQAMAKPTGRFPSGS